MKVTPIIYESYSKSEEKAVGATKYPTRIIIFLTKAGTTSPGIEGTVLFVGDGVRLRGFLQYEASPGAWYGLLGTKSLKFYHRLNTGAWELIATKDYKADGGVFPADLDNYILTKAGTHTFYIEFAGDDMYAGCEKAAKTFAR